VTPKRTLIAIAAVAVAVAGVALAAWSGRREQPRAEARLLVLDGIEIMLADVEPYVAFFDSYMPEGGRKTKIQSVLDEHLIPLRYAQRAFADQRRELKKRADDLCAVAGNVAELELHAGQIVEKRKSEMRRQGALLPVAMYAFEPEQAPLRVGAVSPPLELPYGFIVAGIYDLHESPGLKGDDYVELLQVGFLTHSRKDWLLHFAEVQRTLADKATFVHPDYVHAMPSWIRIPK
jgi:hypothetical protein